jgi:hypothetical protein
MDALEAWWHLRVLALCLRSLHASKASTHTVKLTASLQKGGKMQNNGADPPLDLVA